MSYRLQFAIEDQRFEQFDDKWEKATVMTSKIDSDPDSKN